MTDEPAFDERPLKERIKHRREVGGEMGAPETGAAGPDVADYVFGYGGWDVKLDGAAPAGRVPLPEAVVEHAMTPTPASFEIDEGSTSQRLRERLRARSVLAAAQFAAQENAVLAAAQDPSESATIVDNDRPIIAAPPPPRRPQMPANDLRADLEGPRARRTSARRTRRDRSVRDQLEEAGARMRRAQRIEGGGTVMIGDSLFPLVDWSTGGIAISSDSQRYRVGERAQLELELDLGDYAVNLDLVGEVMNRSAERTGWRFVDPTERQREVLRSITLASLHGRAFTAPTGNNRAPVSATATRPDSGRRRRVNPIAALISLPFNAAVIALVAGAAILVLDEGGQPATENPSPEAPAAEVAQLEPVRAVHAAVAVQRVPLVADQSGLILEWGVSPGEAVDNGEALVSLVLNEGSAADRGVIVSPCDCYLARIMAEAGVRVGAGETIALLYPRGTEGHVQALFAPGTAPGLGDTVTVDLPYSSDTFEGVVESVGRLEDPELFIGLPPTIVAGGGTVYAHIVTDPPVPAALAGDPAIVTLQPGS